MCYTPTCGHPDYVHVNMIEVAAVPALPSSAQDGLGLDLERQVRSHGCGNKQATRNSTLHGMARLHDWTFSFLRLLGLLLSTEESTRPFSHTHTHTLTQMHTAGPMSTCSCHGLKVARTGCLRHIENSGSEGRSVRCAAQTHEQHSS